MASASQFSILVRGSSDGSEETVITYDKNAGVIRIDTTKSSLRDDIFQPFPYPQAAYFPKQVRQSKDVRIQEAPFELNPAEVLALRVFLDRSILEVFANGRQCVTQRIYPSRKDSNRIKVMSAGGDVTVQSIRAWDMARANAF